MVQRSSLAIITLTELGTRLRAIHICMTVVFELDVAMSASPTVLSILLVIIILQTIICLEVMMCVVQVER